MIGKIYSWTIKEQKANSWFSSRSINYYYEKISTTSPSKKYVKKLGCQECLFIVIIPRKRMFSSSSAMRHLMPFSSRYLITHLSLWKISISCSSQTWRNIIVKSICLRNPKERRFSSPNLNNMLPIWPRKRIFQSPQIQTRFPSPFIPVDYSMSWCVGAIEIIRTLLRRWPKRCWILYR